MTQQIQSAERKPSASTRESTSQNSRAERGEGQRVPAIDTMQRTADAAARGRDIAQLEARLTDSPRSHHIRQLQASADARPAAAGGQVVQRIDPVTGAIIGSVVGLGALGAGAYGLYRYLRGREGDGGELDQTLLGGADQPGYGGVDRDLEAQLGAEAPGQLPLLDSDSSEEMGAGERDSFTWAWNATQESAIGERVAFTERDRVLIISESTIPKEATSGLHPDAQTTKTYYPEDSTVKHRIRTKRFAPGDTWQPWDWLEQDFPRRQEYDFVIARSMVCACEDEHFEGSYGPRANQHVVSTCGGVGPAKQKEVLARVLGLLRPGARAIFTVSLRGSRESPYELGTRSLARQATERYWREALGADGLPEEFDVEYLHFPANEKGEPEGEFFGFIISRRGR